MSGDERFMSLSTAWCSALGASGGSEVALTVAERHRTGWRWRAGTEQEER